jgi:ClpP class serine protease
MKNYSHIISKLFYEPTLLTPMRHAALCHLLEQKLSNPIIVGANDSNPAENEHDECEINQVGENTMLIKVHGTLVAHPEDIAMSECGCDMEGLNYQIDALEADPRVKTVIYDFRTPGGSVTMIPETARKIRNSRKDTIGFTDSECCSGGAWLMAQCKQAYMTESARFGSVGVYCLAMDMSRALKKDGIKIDAISAGKYKLMGAYWKPLSDDERAIMQKGVDKIYIQFKDAMESYRVVSDENFGNGLVFDGPESTELGFVDGCVDSMHEVLDMVS